MTLPSNVGLLYCQDGRTRTAAFGNDPLVAKEQTMGSFIAGNSVYTRWTEDGWFKNLMSMCLVVFPATASAAAAAVVLAVLAVVVAWS